jgi:hypothetical protein
MNAAQLSDVYCAANGLRRKRGIIIWPAKPLIGRVGTAVAHASQFPDAGVSL